MNSYSERKNKNSDAQKLGTELVLAVRKGQWELVPEINARIQSLLNTLDQDQKQEPDMLQLRQAISYAREKANERSQELESLIRKEKNRSIGLRAYQESEMR